MFQVVAEAPSILHGETLYKVGVGTGTPTGPVHRTCFDTRQAGLPSDRLFLCRYKVYAGVGGGDSGSPVCQWLNEVDDTDDVTIKGILRGGQDPDPSYPGTDPLKGFVFSPIWGIEQDHGVDLNFQ